MQIWRKLFVVETLKQFSSKVFMSKPCCICTKRLNKLERICEHESCSKGVTVAALEKTKNISVLSFYK